SCAKCHPELARDLASTLRSLVVPPQDDTSTLRSLVVPPRDDSLEQIPRLPSLRSRTGCSSPQDEAAFEVPRLPSLRSRTGCSSPQDGTEGCSPRRGQRSRSCASEPKARHMAVRTASPR